MGTKIAVLWLIDEAMQAGARKSKCAEVLGISVRTIKRWKSNLREDGRKNNKFTTSNKLSKEEKEEVVKICCSEEFRDRTPHQIVPMLADTGLYVASEATMYRILRKMGLLKPRSESKPPQRNKPEELKATGPNQVWSWDITYLRSPVTGLFFYLYLVIDIWDRSVVAWEVHDVQLGEYAAELVRQACLVHGVEKNQLTLHQDNGGPMISSEFMSILKWLVIEPSFSRPGVCDDNPFSESLFRTLKYLPSFPKIFDSLEFAREWVEKFVECYNNKHFHSSISFVTPMQRRTGEDIVILENRQKVYEKAHRAHPERWSGKTRSWERPEEVVLNPKRPKRKGKKNKPKPQAKEASL